MSLKLIVAGSVLLAAAASQSGGPQTYYVDSSRGNDANSGLSAAKSWKSLDKVNSTVFRAGDRILLKAGTAYNGQLRPQGSGSEGRPIAIDMYGQGEKPLIAAGGKFHEALLLKNQEYWEVSNLQLTNTGPLLCRSKNKFRKLTRISHYFY